MRYGSELELSIWHYLSLKSAAPTFPFNVTLNVLWKIVIKFSPTTNPSKMTAAYHTHLAPVLNWHNGSKTYEQVKEEALTLGFSWEINANAQNIDMLQMVDSHTKFNYSNLISHSLVLFVNFRIMARIYPV